VSFFQGKLDNTWRFSTQTQTLVLKLEVLQTHNKERVTASHCSTNKDAHG
jgi:hypothetical protein